MIEEYQNQLRSQFYNSKFKLILKSLRDNILSGSSLSDQLLLIKQRYNDLQDQQMAGTISRQEYTLEKNAINRSILGLINELSEEDVKSQLVGNEVSIKNPILVICPNSDSKVFLDKLLSQINFTNRTLRLEEEVSTPVKGEEHLHDLVIFDNRDLPAIRHSKALDDLSAEEQARAKRRVKLMEAFVKDTPYFIVHLGEHLYWINDNRDRVNAANSMISLYARTRETLDFINSYRVS